MLGQRPLLRAARRQAGTRNFGFPKAILQLNIEYEDGSRASVVSDESWKLTTAGPIRANNEYDGEEYDARMELPGWSRAGFDDSSWEPAQMVAAPAGALAAQMAEPLRVTETLQPVSVKQLTAGRLHFRHGPEHGGLVPPARGRPQGHPGHAAPRRNAESRWLAVHRQPALGARHRCLHAQGRRRGSLGAALHLSRLPLRGSDRISRRSPRRPRSKAAWSTTTWRRPPISPAPTTCSTRFTTTCSGASAATTAAFPPIARSATSARAGWATARR